MQLPSKQRGMGWFGTLIVFAMVGTYAVIGMKVWPLVLNEMKLARAVKSVAHDSDVAGSEGTEKLRNALQKWWNVEDIEFVKPADIKIANVNGGRALTYEYDAEVNVFSNVYVSFHFVKQEPFPKSGF